MSISDSGLYIPEPVDVESSIGYGPNLAPLEHVHQLFSEIEDLVLENTWLNYLSVFPLRAQKAADLVTIEGRLKSTAATTSNNIAVLSTNFRPPYRYDFPSIRMVGGGATIQRLRVDTDGQISAPSMPLGIIVDSLNFSLVAFRTA